MIDKTANLLKKAPTATKDYKQFMNMTEQVKDKSGNVVENIKTTEHFIAKDGQFKKHIKEEVTEKIHTRSQKLTNNHPTTFHNEFNNKERVVEQRFINNGGANLNTIGKVTETKYINQPDLVQNKITTYVTEQPKLAQNQVTTTYVTEQPKLAQNQVTTTYVTEQPKLAQNQVTTTYVTEQPKIVEKVTTKYVTEHPKEEIITYKQTPFTVDERHKIIKKVYVIDRNVVTNIPVNVPVQDSIDSDLVIENRSNWAKSEPMKTETYEYIDTKKPNQIYHEQNPTQIIEKKTIIKEVHEVEPNQIYHQQNPTQIIEKKTIIQNVEKPKKIIYVETDQQPQTNTYVIEKEHKIVNPEIQRMNLKLDNLMNKNRYYKNKLEKGEDLSKDISYVTVSLDQNDKNEMQNISDRIKKKESKIIELDQQLEYYTQQNAPKATLIELEQKAEKLKDEKKNLLAYKEQLKQELISNRNLINERDHEIQQLLKENDNLKKTLLEKQGKTKSSQFDTFGHGSTYNKSSIYLQQPKDVKQVQNRTSYFVNYYKPDQTSQKTIQRTQIPQIVQKAQSSRIIQTPSNPITTTKHYQTYKEMPQKAQSSRIIQTPSNPITTTKHYLTYKEMPKQAQQVYEPSQTYVSSYQGMNLPLKIKKQTNKNSYVIKEYPYHKYNRIYLEDSAKNSVFADDQEQRFNSMDQYRQSNNQNFTKTKKVETVKIETSGNVTKQYVTQTQVKN